MEESLRVKLGESVTLADKRDRILTPLVKLAHLHNVATSYIGSDKKYYEINDDALKKVLLALGVACETLDEIEASTKIAEDKVWLTPIKPTVIEIGGYGSEVDIYLPRIVFKDIERLNIRICLEEGTYDEFGTQYLPVRNLSESLEECVVENVQFEHRVFKLSRSLPLGYHSIILDIPEIGNGVSEGLSRSYTSHLIITPEQAPIPEGQEFGFMTQFYSQRSRHSWGIGDFQDLLELANNLRERLEADFLLINPTHADLPILPQTSSPYFPMSRRFLNPLYLRPESLPEYALLSNRIKAQVDRLARMAHGLNGLTASINRDAVWALKKEALQLIFENVVQRGDLGYKRGQSFENYKEDGGASLTGFAVWCILCDNFGLGGNFQEKTASDTTIRSYALENSELVEFYRWLQFATFEQLKLVQTEFKDKGAKIGVIADLAVGVHPQSADVWITPNAFVKGCTVGAPPDLYNQMGQNWGEPPLNPEYLAQTGYRIFHEMVHAAFQNAGAIRIDHVLGMFRLWYVPEGDTAKEGAYVNYDHDALIGIIALEAHRANAFVIGEDMGVKPAGTFAYLKQRGILGTSVTWFERNSEGSPISTSTLRELCFTAVTTHDIPPTVGYEQGEHVRLRAELGLLTEDFRKVKREQLLNLQKMQNLLIAEGLLDRNNREDEIEVSIALQKALFNAPSKLICFAITDFVGESRAQNQPGTSDEYPNWRVPLEDYHSNLVYNEDMFENEIFERFVTGIPQLAEISARKNEKEGNINVN